ncbi:MAG: type I-U CRISPR-associated protein Cas7 [Acidobacteria bacterium]|nr:MAG: type I-U CRISPR-associated protein Cas7 [Acidobacteriota bacterium]
MIDLKPLAAAPRMLAEASLGPMQTDRFQPTGFPDLGAATYTLADGTEMLLVESAQSMANRTETACWDDGRNTLVEVLDGLPYVHVDIYRGDEATATTASVLEAHRLNSPYVLDGETEKGTFKELFLARAGYQAGQPVDRAKFLAAVFAFDPASLLHGAFMSFVEDGRMRLARAMSSFIEARGVRVAQSGGVKNDRVNPSGDTSKGFGNVPFARTEFTAVSITAFMNLDLRQIRSYALPDESATLLQLLALYKFRKVLADGLRLRTSCDFDVRGVKTTAPPGFALPPIEALEAELPPAISACRHLFADPPVTRVRFGHTESSARGSKKSTRAKSRSDAQT